MFDILLIQPKTGIWDAIRSEFTPPLSLLSICTLVREQYKIKILDQRVAQDWKENSLRTKVRF